MEKSSLKTGISLPPSLHARAVERARVCAGGKFARYVQQLIAADLDHEPTPSSVEPAILERLSRTYAGAITPRLSAHLAAQKADQPALVAELLSHLLAYFEEGQPSFERGRTEADVRLVNLKRLNAALLLAYPQPSHSTLLAAAEAPAPYGQPKPTGQQQYQ